MLEAAVAGYTACAHSFEKIYEDIIKDRIQAAEDRRYASYPSWLGRFMKLTDSLNQDSLTITTPRYQHSREYPLVLPQIDRIIKKGLPDRLPALLQKGITFHKKGFFYEYTNIIHDLLGREAHFNSEEVSLNLPQYIDCAGLLQLWTEQSAQEFIGRIQDNRVRDFYLTICRIRLKFDPNVLESIEEEANKINSIRAEHSIGFEGARMVALYPEAVMAWVRLKPEEMIWVGSKNAPLKDSNESRMLPLEVRSV